jgi:hypothetical protein
MPKILIAGLIESHTISASGGKVGANVIEIHRSDMALYFVALNHISILLIFTIDPVNNNYEIYYNHKLLRKIE